MSKDFDDFQGGAVGTFSWLNFQRSNCSADGIAKMFKPREDSTRIFKAGTVRRQAENLSPLRRLNQAIWLLCTAAREAAIRNIKTITEFLADELINAAKGSSNGCAIKKKDERERVAKSNVNMYLNVKEIKFSYEKKLPIKFVDIHLLSSIVVKIISNCNEALFEAITEWILNISSLA
ncbi:hypothetical protein WA026_022005 [Henosepilachna vigintioctopunctata]|uniref:Small ribosomal subunit protein uS7 domain-containing protein n=1 Tax=Henosepilachna vigintioctopunctata TaxID=420089 RepID=A0AAW1UV83_9CUCU